MAVVEVHVIEQAVITLTGAAGERLGPTIATRISPSEYRVTFEYPANTLPATMRFDRAQLCVGDMIYTAPFTAAFYLSVGQVVTIEMSINPGGGIDGSMQVW